MIGSHLMEIEIRIQTEPAESKVNPTLVSIHQRNSFQVLKHLKPLHKSYT